MVTMSQKEFQRVKVIENAAGGRLSVREAARLLQLSERQVQRLKRRYRPDSVGWVQHGNRGRSMPWAVSLPQKQLILTLARGKYQGFNDSHLTEKLLAEENLTVSRETVRRILRAAKLSSPQKRRPRKYRSRRPPRPRFGMMALTDASRHDWLERRAPLLTLIGFRDHEPRRVPLAAEGRSRGAWAPRPGRLGRSLPPRQACYSGHGQRRPRPFPPRFQSPLPPSPPRRPPRLPPPPPPLRSGPLPQLAL